MMLLNTTNADGGHLAPRRSRVPLVAEFYAMIYPITVVSSKASGAGVKDNNS